MWTLLKILFRPFVHIIDAFLPIYETDQRTGARVITIGCLVIALVLALVLYLVIHH
jgi:hypothetical protein